MSSLQYVVTALIEDMAYNFRLSAVNAIGQGPFVETSDSTIIRDPICAPDPPVHLRITNISATTVSLKWNVPQFFGNLPLSTYVVERKSGKFSIDELCNII